MNLPLALEHHRADLRWALRSMRRAPGATTVAVLSLALGIGANTAIFTLVNAVLLRTLPVPAPEQLRLVTGVSDTVTAGTPSTSWNYPDYLAFRDGLGDRAAFAAMSGVRPLGMQEDRGGSDTAAELAQSQMVSGNYFEVLGVKPTLGRLLGPSDDRSMGGAPWAVLSHEYWRSRFAGDPGVVGRRLRLNGYPFTVVGVAGRGFRGTDPTASVGLFLPIVMQTEVGGIPARMWNSRRVWWLRVMARVRPGVEAPELDARLTAIVRAQQEAEQRADRTPRAPRRGRHVVTLPGGRGHSPIRATLERPLLILLAIVGGVLLIACANLANIMLARAVGRTRELAVRFAIGASRGRIVAQLLTEGALLGAMGGVASLALAYAGVRVLIATLVPDSGASVTAIDLAPDGAVLAFTAAISLATGLIAGLAPAVQTPHRDPGAALADQSRGSAGSSRIWLRRLLVAGQVALSLVLLVGAALFARSLANLHRIDAGFRLHGTALVYTEPERVGYKGQRLHDFYERLLAESRRLPGVRSASLAFTTPLGGSTWNGDFSVEGSAPASGDGRSVNMNGVGPGYFQTMGIPVVAGREFTTRDDLQVLPERRDGPPGPSDSELPGPPLVAVVNESFARRHLAGAAAIGRRVSLTEAYEAARAYEIVGVVKDTREGGLREPAEPTIYVPSWRGVGEARTLCLHVTGDRAAVAGGIRRILAAIDPAVPLVQSRAIEDDVARDLVQERMVATLAGLFGGLALALASVGLYGVLSFLVNARTREIGIRMSLGAGSRAVLTLVVGDVAWLVAGGVLAGTAIALVLARFVRSLLFGIGAWDPVALAAGIAVLGLAAAAAVAVPACRALRVDPSVSLRCE